MRHVKDVLRLTHEQRMSPRAIARSLHLSRNTVRDYLRRFQRAELIWPLPPGINDNELIQRLFPDRALLSTAISRPLPDWAAVHRELQKHRNINLTLAQLWNEYKEAHPLNGYQYTQFCELYHRWRATRDLVMRQSHRGGEKLFLDYTDGLPLVDPATGERIPTQLFVAVWGASNHTYVEASLTQSLPDWIGAHVRAFSFFAAVPHLLVPDNLKSAVLKCSLYEPTLHPTYQDMADHYHTAILPARPRRPRDKAKVEAGVLIAQRWILAALRHRVFHSLADINTAIRELLTKLNDRPLRKIGRSRRQLFDELDRPAGRPLPERPYEFAEWKKATVNIDYHIDVARHFYSVPFRLVRQSVDVKLTATTVEVLSRGERVAAHPRSHLPGRYTTLPAHMPLAHQRHAHWSPSRLTAWATGIGPHTTALVQAILASRSHPEQGYRAVLGLRRLAASVGHPRLEAAAQRANAFSLASSSAVRRILDAGLDAAPLPSPQPTLALPFHENIRGGDYYAHKEIHV